MTWRFRRQDLHGHLLHHERRGRRCTRLGRIGRRVAPRHRLGAFSAVTGLAWLGLSQEKASVPFGVAVVGKRINERGTHFVELLKTDGQRVDGLVSENEYNLLKTGDIGVAWLRDETHYSVLTDFERL